MIENNGTYRVTTTKTPIQILPALRQFALGQAFLTPELTKGVRMLFHNDQRVFIKKLHEPIPFRINMVASVNDDTEPFFTPSFVNQSRRDGIQLTEFSYRAWSDMELLYIQTMPNQNIYIVAIDTRTGRAYHPSLPNLYADGKLCTGGMIIPAHDELYSIPMVTQAEQWLNAWQASAWNADLTENIRNPGMFLRFQESDHLNYIPENTDWIEHTHPISPEDPSATTAISHLYNT
jgi:hypothetical protein